MIIKSTLLRPWCEENIGPLWTTWDWNWWWPNTDCRLQFSNKIKIQLEPGFGFAKQNSPALVSFKNEEDLMLFKLRWL